MSLKSLLFRAVAVCIINSGVAASVIAVACEDHTVSHATPSQVAQADSHRPAWTHEMLQAHNQWRQKVGVAPLTWSEDLATYAQQWANHLAKQNFQLYHRPNNRYGENLTWASHQRLSPHQVVQMWGDEVAHYNYASNQCSGVCGHYTQIVWESTTQVGCAFVRSQEQEIWVCNYNPPGNFRGQRPYGNKLSTQLDKLIGLTDKRYHQAAF